MAESQQRISNVALLVNDYDEAIAYYTDKLNFDLLIDTQVSPGVRWVSVAPKGTDSPGIVLSKANSEQAKLSVGKQGGDGVILFLETSDFWQDYKTMQEKGVKFLETPRDEAYAIVAVFEDPYGNKWDLLQPKF